MDLTSGLPSLGLITQGIVRSGKHTKEYNMWLVDRSAPTPQEKSITETVPFMNGLYDFSDILGERTFENRSLSYTFEILQMDYTDRKSIQTSIENWLMKDGYAPLYDDHAKNYYYIAKCVSVNIDDITGGLSVNIEFDAYPFKISELKEGHDIWDEFNFELDVSIPVDFTIDGQETINLLNVGMPSVVPIITASNAMTIVKGNTTYNVPIGESKSESFRLMPGENEMTITGNGTISFEYFKELI